jgi:hypothetical protein
MALLNPTELPPLWGADSSAFKRKPPFHRAELDPEGKLRNGLVSALLYEPGGWTRDYCQTQRRLIPSNNPFMGDSSVGGCISPNCNGGYFTITPVVPTPNAWTVSVLAFFNNGFPLTSIGFTTDGANNVHFYLQGPVGSVPGALSLNGTNTAVGSWICANYTGWHRITVTASASTGTGIFYFDGVSQGSGAIAVATTQFSNLLGDPTSYVANGQLIADTLVWNRALSPQEVAEHVAAPYRTILRQKVARIVVGTAQQKKKPSLMTTGVGP